MGRPRKKTNKKYIFDNFYIDIDIYKKDVVHFKIRFNYQQENNIERNVSKLKGKVETIFKKEYQYLERSRHIFEVEMVDTLTTRTGRCLFDDYEEFVLQHAQKVMNNLQVLFNQKNFQILLPERTNKYTKTY